MGRVAVARQEEPEAAFMPTLPIPPRALLASSLLLVAVSLGGCGDRESSSGSAATLGDAPVMPGHVDQASLRPDATDVPFLIQRGKLLFDASCNGLDGAGRPETTGTGVPRSRRDAPQNFNRISGPDANACSGCHNLPRSGAGGDNVANVFVLGQRFGFVNFDPPPSEGDGGEAHTLQQVANERNTLGMYGSGWVELLAREMTVDLQGLRAAAVASAQSTLADVTRALVTKGVPFGSLTAHPDGTVDTSLVVGVNADLVVRPFHQKGAVVSLREFTNNATNHHHGMQSSERFGAGVDADRDGMADELSVGDVTALTVFQATLPVPGRVLPPEPGLRQAVAEGETLFGTLGCAACHVPTLRVSDPTFREPNPFNPAGNLRPADVPASLAFDLTQVGEAPHLPKENDGTVLVPLYSDLKRHDMGPLLDDERLVQAGIPTKLWLTKKLWGFASEPPYLHNGRATTIAEAVLAHGGEGQASRDAFAALVPSERDKVLGFLRSLQVLPANTPTLSIDGPAGEPLGDAPVVRTHVSQAAVEAGAVPVDQLIAAGHALFAASFNTLDGQGRPTSTGTGAARLPRAFPQNFNRISGPDANACSGCHNLPSIGGGGDQVANVFVLGQRFPFVNFEQPAGEGDGFQDHTLAQVANERNTLGMFGSGFVELLAREITVDLQAIRAAAIAAAALSGHDETRDLLSKGIAFGRITAHANATVDTTEVAGIDADLVVRPFHQKGVVVSLREFSNNAMNHHHGMQSTERFGLGLDPDGDGIADELTVGDMTAVTIFQATLPAPIPVEPESLPHRLAASSGRSIFGLLGCATCHVPSLRLTSPMFTEPNPFNPVGNLRPSDVSQVLSVDLTTAGPGPHLGKAADGHVDVPVFTDFRRHDLGPALDTEALVQAGVPTKLWLTKKLWGFASEPPFMHHGRATTITEAIRMHGGEAQASRDAFVALSAADQAYVIEFLKTLRDPE